MNLMDHLNELSIVLVIGMVFYVRFLLHTTPKTRTTLIHVQLFLTLLYNVGILFVIPGKVPVELSTVAYFVIPTIVFLNLTKIDNWAVYSAVMAGGIYYLAMVVFGTRIYGDYPPYSVYTSLFNHASVLTYAIVTLKLKPFPKQDRYIIWIGLALSIVWALLIRPVVTHTGIIFIYEILDASIVSLYFEHLVPFSTIGYYILLAVFLYTSSNLVHWLSKALYRT